MGSIGNTRHRSSLRSPHTDIPSDSCNRWEPARRYNPGPDGIAGSSSGISSGLLAKAVVGMVGRRGHHGDRCRHLDSGRRLAARRLPRRPDPGPIRFARAKLLGDGASPIGARLELGADVLGSVRSSPSPHQCAHDRLFSCVRTRRGRSQGSCLPRRSAFDSRSRRFPAGSGDVLGPHPPFHRRTRSNALLLGVRPSRSRIRPVGFPGDGDREVTECR